MLIFKLCLTSELILYSHKSLEVPSITDCAFNAFVSEFLKWGHPDLNLDTFIVVANARFSKTTTITTKKSGFRLFA